MKLNGNINIGPENHFPESDKEVKAFLPKSRWTKQAMSLNDTNHYSKTIKMRLLKMLENWFKKYC